MKALMLVCIGINIPIICFGIMLNSMELTALGFMSSTLCYIGYRYQDEKDEQEPD